MKKRILLLTNLIVIMLVIYACNQSQSHIDRASTMLNRAEGNIENYSQSEFDNLELEMGDLEKDLESNRKNYTDAQIREIGKLQGRYAALLVKKGLGDFQKSVKDLSNQAQGFIEGISDSVENKNK